MNQSKISILIDSAFGRLGSLVTKHALLRDNLLVNILVRNPDKNKELVQQVEQAGGKVIKADLGDPESLRDVTKGIHTVISTVSAFDWKVDVDGQLALLDDAVKNGVKRFVHSYYSDNCDTAEKEDLPLLEQGKKYVRDAVKKASIGAIDISIGLLIEWFFEIQSDGPHYAGDANQKLDFTSYEDTAKYIVAVVSREDLTGTFMFVGQEATMPEFVNAYNKVRKTDVKLQNLGSLEEFKKQRDEARQKNSENTWVKEAEYMMYTGLTKFLKNNNTDFPEVVQETLEQVIARDPSLKLN